MRNGFMNDMAFDTEPSERRLAHERAVAEDQRNNATERMGLMEELLELNPFMEDWEFDNLTNDQMRRKLNFAMED